MAFPYQSLSAAVAGFTPVDLNKRKRRAKCEAGLEGGISDRAGGSPCPARRVNTPVKSSFITDFIGFF
jgi:hypothetical protein